MLSRIVIHTALKSQKTMCQKIFLQQQKIINNKIAEYDHVCVLSLQPDICKVIWDNIIPKTTNFTSSQPAETLLQDNQFLKLKKTRNPNTGFLPILNNKHFYN